MALPLKYNCRNVIVRWRSTTATPVPAEAPPSMPGTASNVVFSVSGYIINCERIELSPRFFGVVNWIGVKKENRVARDPVVALLDDTEQHALVAQARARVETGKVRLQKGRSRL